MPTTRQRIWAYASILVFGLTVGMFGFAAQDLDYGMLIIIMIPAAILLMGASMAITGLSAWLYRPSRRFFWPINLGLMLVLMLAFSWYFYERMKFPGEFEQVKAYVALAVPALHDYHSQHGKYPDSLAQLSLSVPIPSGLQYQRFVDPGINIAPSCMEGPGSDVYCINFEEAHLDPDGGWFLDD
jgi:hypothetical protein